ncbi:fatty acid synthase S-acetyltransferase [Apiospora kogelbergensis]|uniref:fatty acid synthase S-acetyltransferase n=1 Tax=Apiospora kogelbergensis TaxID=1337665 RepID=UPI003130C03F
MTLAQWVKAAGPKVKGAWYLYEATVAAGIELDFFVFLSSMSGLTGQPGQANYAGANTFLDAFALWRNGYSGVTETEMIEAFRAAGSYPVPDLNDGVAVGMRRAPFAHTNTFATGFGSDKSLRHPDSRLHWKKDLRMAVWHNIRDSDVDGAGAAGGGDGLKAFLARAKGDPETLQKPETVGYLALEIGKQLMNLLLRPDDDLDVTLPVQQLGLDSLVGIELRNWWRQTFRFDVSVLQLLGFGTLEELGRQAAVGLLKACESAQ